MATRVLNSKIEVQGFKPFKAVGDVKITKSINNTLDTAIIKLPASAVLKQSTANGTTYKNLKSNYAFKRGQHIQIHLGYNGQLKLEFEGWIANVTKSIPCVLECEGYAFELRNRQIKKVYAKTTLKQVIKDLIKGTSIELHPDNEDVQIDKLVLTEQSCFDALGVIKQQLADAVNIWFEGPYIRFGLKYLYFSERNQEGKADVVYKTGWNCLRDGQLKERLAGDKAYEVQLISKGTDGKEQKITAGVPNSNVERKKVMAVIDPKEKERLAEALVGSKDYTGVEGSLTAFLEPKVIPGNKVKIIDERYPELSGSYLAEEVVTTFGRSGARRKVKLSVKL